MKRLVVALLVLLALIACASCGGGGDDITPDPSEVLAVSAVDGQARIHAGPGSADAGTTAEVVAGGTGQATVDADGSFTFDAQITGAAGAVSQATTLTVQYVKSGATLTSDAVVVAQESLVTAPLFSTGSAPNDMVFGHDSLYIANSLDNTVVRYGLDGTELAMATFDEYASPSYLGLGETTLYVLTNGDNHLYGFDTLGLAATGIAEDIYATLETDASALAFPGPGVPVCSGDTVYFPLAMITAFDAATVYSDTHILQYPKGSNAAVMSISANLAGHNGSCCALNPATGDLLATSAGEVQFDEFWMPYVTTDSYLDIVKPGKIFANINLGQIGAGRIAVAPDGTRAFIGNSLNGNLYSVDLEAEAVLHGANDPIVLTEEFTYIADVAYTPDGRYILAASFNTDELYVIDAATDELNPGPYPAPFDLALDPELMAGAANIEIDPTPRTDGGYDVYVLYGVANAVAKIALF